MKRVTIPILLILTLLAAYALGRTHGGTAADAGETPAGQTEMDPFSVASFRAALDQPDVLERSYRFHGFLQTLSSDEIAEVSEIIESRSLWLEPDELLSFMLAWARFDAPAAFEWALSRSDPFRSEASTAAIEAWAFHDPAAARRAIESVEPRTLPVPLGEYLVAGWLRGGHHDGVMEYILDQPPGNLRQRYTNLLTIELMRDGPDAVVRWVESIPDDAPGSFKTMAFQKAANILATVDPVRTSRWIEPHLEHAYAAEAPAVIGRRWLEIDPPAALDWLASLPRTKAHDEALQLALRSWLQREPQVAEKWVRTTSETPAGSAAVQVMIAQHEQDPPTAIAWAQRIADPVERARTVVRLGRAWHRREPEASRRWIEESDLPAHMQNAILKRPTSRRRTGGGGPKKGDAGLGPAS